MSNINNNEGQQQENQSGQQQEGQQTEGQTGQQLEGEDASETTEMSAGAKALEDCEKAYADMTATYVELGLGDCQCDWRAPLAKVDIFNAAEKKAAEDSKTDVYTYVEYGANAEKLTGAEAATKAETFHVATDKKKRLLWEYYPEILEEKYPEDAATFKAEEEAAKSESGEGEEPLDPDGQ